MMDNSVKVFSYKDDEVWLIAVRDRLGGDYYVREYQGEFSPQAFEHYGEHELVVLERFAIDTEPPVL